MNKCSSLVVLILLGSLVADAVAQTNPQRPGQGQGQGQGQGTFQPIPVGQHPGQILGQQPGGQFPQHPQHPSQQGQWPSQPGMSRVISQRVSSSIRPFESVRLVDLMRLSMNETRNMEALSVTISAQALRSQASLDLRVMGRPVSGSMLVTRRLSDIRIVLPLGIDLEQLEVSASDDLILDTISVEVQSGMGRPGQMRPMSGQLLSLNVNEYIRGAGEIALKQLVRQQLGLNLQGAAIERIALQVQLMGRQQASVQLEMNGRLIGLPKLISGAHTNIPLLINSREEVQGNLRLIIRGDVAINGIAIRLGQVR